MRPGPRDVPVRIKIEGEELRELQEHTGAMAESFGLDRKIEEYQGRRPLTLYRWDVECLLDIIDMTIEEAENWSKRKHYPGARKPKAEPLRSLLARLRKAYAETYPS
jgi:hypothetical protein